jgi:hypothetical protein
MNIFVKYFCIMRKTFKLFGQGIIGIFLLIISLSAFSQEFEEPIVEKLRDKLVSKEFSISPLLQAGYSLNGFNNGEDAFNVGAMRLLIKGELDNGLSYFIQPDFAVNPIILDASFHWKYNNHLKFGVGIMKTPFSTEFIISAANLDFVNRSMVVSNLASNRQLGFNVEGYFYKNLAGYNVGVYNGNGRVLAGDNNNALMKAARLFWSPIKEESEELKIGLHGYINSQPNLFADFLTLPDFEPGDQRFRGADIRYGTKKIILAGEIIAGKIQSNNIIIVGREYFSQNGYYLTGGYKFNPKVYLLGRFEAYADDINPNRNQFIIGTNLFPASFTEIQINYVTPLTSGFNINNNSLLIALQFGYC